jgi:hypothetical protein
MTRTSLACALVFVASPVVAAPPPVSAVAYTPDGHLTAFGLHGEVALHSTSSARTTVIQHPNGRVTALQFAPTRAPRTLTTWLAVACGEPGKQGVVHIYSLNTDRVPSKNPVATIAGHKDSIYALAASPDGSTLATAGYDRDIHLWDLDQKWPDDAPLLTKPKRTLKDHSDAVYGLAFHPDGKLLASASADRTVKVWEVAAGTRLYTLSDPTDWLYSVAWSPDGKRLAAGGVDKSVRVWEADATGGKLVNSAFAHAGAVTRVAYGPDGKTLFTVGEDRVIKRWNADKLTEERAFDGHKDTILGFALSPDGKRFIAGRFDGVGGYYDSDTGKHVSLPLPLKPVAPQPQKVTPNGLTRATTGTVRVTGKYLHTANVTCVTPGVRLSRTKWSPDWQDLEITINSDVAPGPIQLQFENEAGKASVMLVVDRFDSVVEAGGTDSARTGMQIRLPRTVLGTIDRAGDADYFRFAAKAGEQIGAHVTGAELGSKLDAVLVLTNAAGDVLAEGNGPHLGFKIPTAGTYAIGIRDREYRGGADMTYRLHVGDTPVVTGVFPLGVQRGKTANVHVEGVNLGRGEITLPVTVPADAVPGSRIPVPNHLAPDKAFGNATVVVDEFPSVVVDPANGAEVRVPGTADGILMKSGDAQTVRFGAKKGVPLIVEVNARRAGSPVDPVIEILDAAGKPVPRAVLRCTAKTFVTFRDHDSAATGIRLDAWNELAIDDYLFVDGELVRILALPKGPDDDCQFYQVGGQRTAFLGTSPVQHAQGSPMYKVEIHPPGREFPPNGLPVFPIPYRNDDGGAGYGKDAALTFKAPADGLYQVRVSDSRGAGGPTHAYRLTVRTPAPSFRIAVSPNPPTVSRGGAVPLTVTATRADGHNGEIMVSVGKLPPGLSMRGSRIQANQTTTTLALYAEPDAKIPDNTTITLLATGGDSVQTKDGVECGTMTHELTVPGLKLVDPGDIVTTTKQSEVVVKPGQQTTFVVEIERRNKFGGRVPVEVRGLPHGVRVLNIGLNGILLTERDTSREVVIYAEPWVKPMEHPIVVTAKREGKNTDHAAKSVLLKVEK